MKFVCKNEIQKGFSDDQKYCVTDENGAVYLLRQADLTRRSRKEEEFQLMKQLDALGLSMCRPVALWSDKAAVYSLHSWVSGDDLETVLPRLSKAEQYRLGLEAGRQLRIIHSVASPDENIHWSILYSEKENRTLYKYQSCPTQLPQDAFFVDALQCEKDLLQTRPVRLQHGDFHRANLMVNRQGQLVVIDFQKFGWGDPWEEFDAITWDVQLAPAFARGRVDGYFDGAPPEDFWKLLRLYVCRGLLNGWVWAQSHGDEQVQIMLEQANMIRSWYIEDGAIPAWYLPLGLKRGTVRLQPHDPCWSVMAEECITELKTTLGDVALDIQHVGSTAVRGIHAKPILDIAVCLHRLEDMEPWIPVLAEHSMIYRGSDQPGQLLFVKGDFEQDTRTHHIHMVTCGSAEWENYRNFRDYLNAMPEKAQQYDQLKLRLAARFSEDRGSYTAGKAELVTQILKEARIWREAQR